MKMLKVVLPLLLCLSFLNGCASKQTSSPALTDHSVEVVFAEYAPGLCHVYLIADDTLVYDFKANGNYSIIPGEYMAIMQCQQTNYFFAKENYGAGNITKFTSPGGKEQTKYDSIRKATNSL